MIGAANVTAHPPGNPAPAAADARAGQDPVAVFLGPGSRLSVPREALLRGGPAVDGIPALDAPRKVARSAATHLGPDDRVLGFSHGGEAVAYPLRILNWHEVANDTVGGLEIAATFCPLTGSPIVFQRSHTGRGSRFGVSGLIYNSNLVMFDRQTGSLWPQMLGKAVSGESLGEELKVLPGVYTTWSEWAKAHPETTVLSPETGHARDYGRDPYAGYADTPKLFFPVGNRDARLPTKEIVTGLELAGKHLAVPLAALRRAKTIPIALGLRAVTLRYSDGPHAFLADGRERGELPLTVAYWFAWAAMHPDTLVWTHPSPSLTAPLEAKPAPVALKASDGVHLAATYYAAQRAVKGGPVLVLMPMLGAGRTDWDGFATHAAAAGVAVLTLDPRGHGQSANPFGQEPALWSKRQWDQTDRDPEAAVGWLERRGFVPESIFVGGASIGASLALRRAARDSRLAGAVLVSPGDNPLRVPVSDWIGALGRRRLFIAAAADDPQFSAIAERLAVASAGPVERLSLPAGGHGTAILTHPSSGPALERAIILWIRRQASGAQGRPM